MGCLALLNPVIWIFSNTPLIDNATKWSTSPSALSTVICAAIYPPCTASCEPRRAGDNFLENGFASAMGISVTALHYLMAYTHKVVMPVLSAFSSSILSPSLGDLFSDIFEGIYNNHGEIDMDIIFEGIMTKFNRSNDFEFRLDNQYYSTLSEGGNCTRQRVLEYSNELTTWQNNSGNALQGIKARLLAILCCAYGIIIAAGVILAKHNMASKSTTVKFVSFWQRHTRVSLLCGVVMFFVSMLCLAVVVSVGQLGTFRLALAIIGLHVSYLCVHSLFVNACFAKNASSAMQQDEIPGKLHRFLENAWRLRSRLRKLFGVGGKYFMLIAMAREIVEVAIQGSALVGSAHEDDIMLIAGVSAVLFANCVIAPILSFRGLTSAVTISDAVMDIMYAFIGVLRLAIGDRAMSWSSFLSLAFPLLCVADLVASLSYYEMKQNGKRDSSNLLPKRRVSVLQLPNTRTYEQATAKRVFVSLWALLFLECFVFGSIAVVVSVRGLRTHLDCKRLYGGCIMKGASPRKYFYENGMLGIPNCGESQVIRMNVDACDDDATEVINRIDFAPFSSLKSIGSQYDSLANKLGKMSRENGTLDLRGNYEDSAKLLMYSVSIMLPKRPNLENLILSGLDMDNQGAHIVANALKYTTFLKKLHLGHNSIGDNGAQKIAAAVRHLDYLSELDLKFNLFSDEGVNGSIGNMQESRIASKVTGSFRY